MRIIQQGAAKVPNGEDVPDVPVVPGGPAGAAAVASEGSGREEQAAVDRLRRLLAESADGITKEQRTAVMDSCMDVYCLLRKPPRLRTARNI